MKTIIHVNQHVIKANRKSGLRNPVLAIKTYRSTKYAQNVSIDGPSHLVYRPDRPLSCGAHVWIETESAVVIND